MAIQETIKTGRKYRKCIDNTSTNKKWERYSFWSKASDVEFNDGTTAENKLGSFKGVTTNENQSAGYAADVTLLKSIKTALTNSITSVSTSVTNLNNLITSVSNRLGGMRFYEDSTGKYVVGADSVPKKLGSGGKILGSNVINSTPGFYTRQEILVSQGEGWASKWYQYKSMYIFDIKKIRNDYMSLTKDNFILVITKFFTQSYSGPKANNSVNVECIPTYTYDSNSGILTIDNVEYRYSQRTTVDGSSETNKNVDLKPTDFYLLLIDSKPE